jgi:predicted aldo/keto reductase-like oxidoreductase
MTDIVSRLRDPSTNWNSGGRFEAADEIERLRAALGRIRYAGFNDHPTCVWMQKVAAHGMDPHWPDPGELKP